MFAAEIGAPHAMGRPREFDMDTALGGAMEIFWRQGFDATNLPDLLTAMGLTRGSFYKAFKDKESVYLAALDQYDQEVVSRTVALLGACDAATPSACLALLFAPSEGPARGCFICNAMVELGPISPEVKRRTTQMAGRLRTAIRDVLIRYGWQEGAEETADVVLHLYFGHQALGKAAAGRDDWPERLARVLAEPAELGG